MDEIRIHIEPISEHEHILAEEIVKMTVSVGHSVMYLEHCPESEVAESVKRAILATRMLCTSEGLLRIKVEEAITALQDHLGDDSAFGTEDE